MQKYSTTVSKFQSTHPSGVRPGRHRLLLGRGAISIHAPQWGATSYIPPATPAIVFQSTHPSGVRLRRLCTGCRLSDFNPRTPVECDHPPRMWLARHAISIHAPREGCDYQNGDPTDVRTVFQSTRPVRGATEHDADLVVDVVISIHAPREGCDFQPAPFVHERTISIHAPREGCDYRSSYTLL